VLDLHSLGNNYIMFMVCKVNDVCSFCNVLLSMNKDVLYSCFFKKVELPVSTQCEQQLHSLFIKDAWQSKSPLTLYVIESKKTS